MGVIVEVCVDTSASLRAAVEGGADRIELCAALALGGLTPSAGFMAEAAGLPVPVMAMIRPRAGDFAFSEPEMRQMETDIATARAAGLAGVVLGASLPDGRLDTAMLTRLLRAAGGMDTTLHRAFDLTPDLDEALETAIDLGFHRILTSGGGRTAPEGMDRIGTLIAQAAGRISILPGAGISAASAAAFVALGVTELHGSCATPRSTPGRAAEMGFGPPTTRQTDAALVRALRQAVSKAVH